MKKPASADQDEQEIEQAGHAAHQHDRLLRARMSQALHDGRNVERQADRAVDHARHEGPSG